MLFTPNSFTRYGYNDVMIRPDIISGISSRSECNPFDEEGFLPIFAAPMSSVVDLTTYQTFEENHIHTILPRSIELHKRELACSQGCWTAFSLSEFEDLFCNEEKPWNYKNHIPKVLIDIANGHMMKLYQLTSKAKQIHGDNNIIIMVGNIANAKTIEFAEKVGHVDYIRVSIGAGAGCITASNTGIYDAPASLLDECYKIKQESSLKIKIIADGGIRSFSDINKALALGADYVMIGGMLSQLIGSAGTFFYTNEMGHDVVLDYHDLDKLIITSDGAYTINGHHKVYKKFYGMASAKGQIDISGKKTKTAEGIEKTLQCTTTIKKWSENANAYLRSAMSYCGIEELRSFNPDNVNVYVISQQSKQSINL